MASAEQQSRFPPRRLARICGSLYLLGAAAGLFSEAYVRGGLLVSGDAAATARNILASELLYRLGGAAQLVALCCDVGVALLLYVLLAPVGRFLSRLAAAHPLVFEAILAAASIFHFMPLMLLGNAPYLQAFTPGQLQALALLSTRLYGTGFVVANIFFGLHCILIGGLIAGSRFLPRLIGWALLVAGICYVINSFVLLTAPALREYLGLYILLPGLVAEWSLALWLALVGLNGARWQERAAAAPPPLNAT
jgi:hypothetical protein